MTAHDSLAKTVIETLLARWKGSEKSEILSHDVFLTKSNSSFPSPDGTFFDPINSFSSALEFKPPTETKRGILTGLGQSIAYLDKHSLSYLVIPSQVEQFDIQTYMNKIFDLQITEKMPVGLIVYDSQDPTKILIHKEPKLKIKKSKMSKKSANEGRYWAKWIDFPTQAIWILLDLSYTIDKDKKDKKKAIWDNFFLTYVYPKKYHNKFDAFNTGIINDNGEPYRPLQNKLKKWKESIINGIILEKDAIDELKNATDMSNQKGDRPYTHGRKNSFPFLNNLGVWDDFGNLSEIGYELHKIGKIHGPRSKTFIDALAKVTLQNGKHLDLILDIEKYTRNKNFDTSTSAINHVIDELTKKGLISGKGNKKFGNEFQLWGRLGLVQIEGDSYYIKNKGFNFNWEKITSLL
jgi:hypothetical protein